MVDFLEKLASFSDGIAADPLSGARNPTLLNVDFSPIAQSPLSDAPTVAAVPTTPVVTGQLGPLPTPSEVANNKLLKDLDLINKALVNPNAMAMVNLSRERNNDLTRDNQILNDRNSMKEPDFIRKYGDDVFQKVSVLDAGRGHVTELSGGSRNGGQIAGDVLVGAGSGLVQSLGGVAALGAGALNKRAGVALSEGLSTIKEGTDSLQSQTMQRRKFVDSMRGQLDKQDNQNRYEQDKQESGELIASLKSIGRGVISGAGRLGEDPTMLEAGLSEAAGSLLAGGPIAKGLSAGATTLSGRLLTSAPGAVAAGGVGARAAEQALAKGAFPMAIGSMEAGGSYAQTIQEVMRIPEETLLKESTAYKALRDSGMTERDAKIELATKAGNVASALTFPVGALTGTLVAKFEASPLLGAFKGGPAKVAGNMTKEFVEEGIQSGVGEFAGNLGQKLTVDPNKNLGEGVGEQAIQGAIFGAGSAGAMQAPGLAARGVREAGRAILAPIGQAISEKANVVRAENEAASPLAPEKIKADLAQVSSELPSTAEAVRSVINDPTITAEQKPIVEQLAQKVETIFSVTPDEITKMPVALQDASSLDMGDGNRPSRFDLMSMASMMARNTEESQENRTSSALWLLGQLSEQDDFIRQGNDVLGKLDNNRPEVASFQRFSQILDSVSATKEMQDALEWARSELQAPKLTATDDLSTPAARQTVQATAEIARLVPEKLDLVTADVILRQDKLTPDGSKLLTPSQRQDIHAAAALAQASEAYSASLVQATNANPAIDRIDIVNREINTIGGKAGYQKSLTQHAFDINFALRNGMPDAARQRIQHLGMFARSMRNKVEAMNRAILAGDRKDVPYRALGPDNKWLSKDGTQRVFYNPGTEKSQLLARQIYADAVAVNELSNAFAREYSQFGIAEISLPALAVEPAVTQNQKNTAKAPSETKSEPAAEGGSSKLTSKVASKSQATTSETDPDPSQIELPPSLTQPAPKSAATQAVDPKVDDVENAAKVGENSAKADVADAVSSSETLRVPRPETAATVGSLSETSRGRNTSKDTTQKTEEAFPSLVKPEGRNLFHEAFRFAKEQTSNLMAEEHPIAWIYEQLGDSEKYKALKELLNLVDGAGDAMTKRLLEHPKSQELLEKLTKGEPVNRYMRGRVLNLVEQRGDSFAYHNQLLEAALSAGADWLANGQQGMANMDREEIAAAFGINNPTSDMVAFFNRGMSLNQAKQQLARRIVEFWGMQANPDADIVYAEGIPQALAAEMLLGFQEMGLVVYENVDRYKASTGKSYGRVYFDMRSRDINQMFSDIGATRKAITELTKIKSEVSDSVQIGAPITDVSKTQLRNAVVSTTRAQRKAIAREQAVPYLLNQPMFELIKQMGEDAFVTLMAGRTDSEKLNVNHARSVEGTILGLRTAFRDVSTHTAEMQAYADEKNMDLNQVPTFFRHEITRVGRLQMMGSANPQSDKLAREILMPTRSELDLNDPKHLDFFWLTVAQGLGVKTEKMTRSASREKAEAKIAKDFALIVSELKTWLASQDRDKPGSLSADLAQRIRDAAGGSITMHGFHSLLSVARLTLAQEKNQDLSKFEHFNYLEADGKTNGPINALMLLAGGVFNTSWVQAVRKGGVFLGQANRGRTLNSLGTNGNEADKADLYQAAAVETELQLASLMRRLSDNPPVQAQMQALFRLFNHLNADISFDESSNTVTIARGVAKNPLTISIYGSGDDGIAGKVASELVELIYAKMSEFMSSGASDLESVTYDGFKKDLAQLINSRANFNKEKNTYEIFDGFEAKKGTEAGNLTTPENFTLGPHHFSTLKANVRTLFVDELASGIDATVMGHVKETTAKIQKATQIQSIVMQALFRRAIVDKLIDRKADDADYRDGDFLSRKDLEKIVRDLLPMGPAFNAGDQSYFLAGSEQGNILGNVNDDGRQVAIQIERDGKTYKISVPESFSRSLSDDMGGTALIYGPGLAGVKSIPTLVIGSGDGQMMLNAANDASISRTLKVFDGMNMAADMIEDYSKAINGHVRQTWDHNPVRDVATAFRAFLSRDPFSKALDPKDPINAQSQIMQQALLELTKTVVDNPKPKTMVSAEEIMGFAESTAADLERIADEIDKRQAVLRKIPMTVDQMASGETPFIQDGELEIRQELTELELVEQMNTMLGTGALDAESAKGMEKDPQREPSIRVIEAKALTPDIMGGYTNLNNTQRELLAASLRALTNSGYRVVTGSADQADAWLQENNADRYQPGQLDGANGFVDPVAKIMVVTNGSTETTLHELIHAATYATVASYYADPSSVSEAHSQAIKNLEELMENWIIYDRGDDNELTQSTKAVAVRAIYGHLDNGNKAAALNEFMAWVLSNQDLAKSAAKIRITVPIHLIISEALNSLWQLITGKNNRKVPQPKDGEDVLSSIKFNTRILMELPSQSELLVRDSSVMALYQSRSFGTSDRLSELRQRFHEKVTRWVASHDVVLTGDLKVDASRIQNELNLRTAAETKSNTAAVKVGEGFIHAGFLTTDQEKTTFNQILAAMSVDVELNSNARSRIQDIYDHVMSVLDPAAFLKNDRDPQQDAYQSQEKLKALQGLFGQSRDALDRSSLLPGFLALGMVDEQFRGILSKIRMPVAKATVVPGVNESAVDRKLVDLGITAMDRLSQWVSGEGSRSGNPDTQILLDRLVRSMLENTGDARSQVELSVENSFDRADKYVYNRVQKITDNINLKAQKVINTSQSKLVKATAYMARASAAIVNETQSSAIAMGVISQLNKSAGLTTLRDVATSVVGRQADNAGIYDMITKVRNMVDQARQQYRENLPKTFAAQFTRKLTGEEWSALHRAIGKTDMAVIHKFLGISGAIDVLTNIKSRDALISKLENAIIQQDAGRSKLMLQKAHQLAHYMVTGEHGTRLLRNAYAVARLAGQGGQSRRIVSEELVDNIDRLATLYAIQEMDAPTMKMMADLASETKGLDFVMSYMRGLRTTDMNKGTDPVARLNMIKGYIPASKVGNQSLVVKSDREHSRLTKLGYTRVGDYVGSSAEAGNRNRGYYLSSQSGQSIFNQGVLRTVHMTAGGIDPSTGFMVGEATAGRITDPAYVRNIAALIGTQRQTTENLLEVFDANGNVRAYERALDPKQMARLSYDTNLSRSISAWVGRQVEEEQAIQVNLALVDELAKVWDEGQKSGRRDEFVNLARLSPKDDPILHEAWRLVPSHIRKQIEASFGAHTFMVRRDMLNDAVGYRSASVGDIFTGETRWNPKVVKQFEDIALAMFGNKAYSRLLATEHAVQDLVTNAKVLIVVKSVVVPVANMMSNILQMANRGVPVRHIIKGLGTKTDEINAYIRRRHQEIDLAAELRVAQGAKDLVSERRLNSRIQTLRDSYRSLSIWPLIEAGEFSAISNGVVTAEDLALAEGKWGQWSERLATKMPGGLKTAWRYGFVTRDTALFQGLGKAVQYGDFIGKAILFEDLTRRRKMSKVDALAQVGEAFINYNRLAGRSRQYLESVGLLWFYNFKLRSIKEGAYLLRHHPLRSLLMMALPGSVPIIGSIGSPITDNLIGVAAEGNLGYSIGPGMGFNAFSLNPWVSMVK